MTAKVIGRWLTTNATEALPLTREKFEETVKAFADIFKSGRMTLQPDWFNHMTPCCARVYATTGICADKCPYECGKPFVQGKWCPTCKIMSQWFKRSLRRGR